MKTHGLKIEEEREPGNYYEENGICKMVGQDFGK